MRDFTIIGKGGTDFRPAFEYVNRLREQGAFRKLRGLLYFTDGEGIYPVRRPVYDTAFVFMKEQYTDVSVPPWAIKLILEPEEIESPPHAGSEESMVSPTHVGPAESIEMENSDEH